MKIFCLLFVLLLSASASFSQTWSKLPNLDANVLSVYVSENNIVAGLESGCQYTDDEGITWNIGTGLTDKAKSFSDNGNELYAASNETVYKSDDNAVSWTGLTTIFTFTDVNNVTFSNERIIAGMNGRGIWFSDDNGLTWQEATTSWQSHNSGLMKFNNKLFASYQNSGGLQVSEDNGATWLSPGVGTGINIQSSWPDISALSSLGDSVLIAGTKNGGIFNVEDGVFFSKDDGNSWVKKVKGLEDSSIVALTTIKGIVFAGTETAGIFYSTDLGDNWIELNSGLSSFSINNLFIQGSNLYCSTTDGIYKNDLCFLLIDNIDITDSACDSFTLNDQTYTQSGMFEQFFTNQFGCDSTLQINLVINNSAVSTVNETACNDFTFNGELYNESGNFTQTLVNHVGCDSTITLNLTIQQMDTTVMITDDSLWINLPNADYQWLNCNNGFELLTDEIERKFTTSIAGNYAAIIDNGVCVDTTKCILFPKLVTGVRQKGFNKDIVLYPNPTIKDLVIDLGQIYSKVTMIVRDFAGKTIDKKVFINQRTISAEIANESGVYFIELVNENNEKKTLKVVKN